MNIIKQVHEHRLLNSEHICALQGGQSQGLIRRLNLLYHSGYLDRPKAQTLIAGNQPMVYGLGNQGAEVLAQEFGQTRPATDWTSKNREIKTIFLEHALTVAEFMIVVRLACRQRRDVEFIGPNRLIERRPPINRYTSPLGWKINISQQYSGLNFKTTVNLVPDAGFGLKVTGQDGRTRSGLFFFEADRATMPIRRTNLRQSSFHKKLVCYWESYRQTDKDGRLGKVFYENFGFRSPRLLTLTTSHERIESMIDAQKGIDPQGKGFRMFLFAPINSFDLNEPQAVFQDDAWLNGQQQATGLLK